MEDDRFKHVTSDSKFRRAPKPDQRKLKIDNRFQAMFNNKHFKVNYKVDKRGRPLEQTSSEDLRRFYEIGSDEESDSEEEEKAPELEEKHGVVSNKVKERLRDLQVDYARGEGRLCSESSSDDDDEEDGDEGGESEEDVGIEHKWGEMDGDAEKTDEITRRLAACNMDWDRIRAVDLMMLFHSFLPPTGCIESVRIYPSEFGKKRMREEEIKGPMELVEAKTEQEDGNHEEGEEGSNYHMEKLRLYQLNRLKYYYAVIVCDSANTANKIYTECDGMEYESSATKIDLRFIPDDMTFDDEPKESCEKLPEVNKYQPRFFTTTALQQAKVDLTWDETNPDRVELAQKLSTGKVDDVTDADLEAYLALSSEEESEEENENSDGESSKCDINKYKALLAEIEEAEEKKKNKDVEMEITWGLDLEKKAEEVVKKKMDEKEEKTPFEKYLEKRKQKRKERKKLKQHAQEDSDGDSDVPSDVDLNDPYFAEEFKNNDFIKKKPTKKTDNPKTDNTQQEKQLELLLMNDDDDNKHHFNLKHLQESENKTKKKRKRGVEPEKEDDFQVDVKDARFSALYTSHHFNVDPTDPHFKKTKGMQAIVQEKMKRRVEGVVAVGSGGDGGKKRDAELSVLVKSVKRKANAFASGKK